jgi:hypothetical protein
VSTKAINTRFPGSEELHVLMRTDEKGGIKRPEVMAAIERFQAHMLSDLTLGGAKAIPGVLRVVNKLTHNDDPRWMQVPDTADEVGGLMFAYMAASPIPGALKEFRNADENEANMVFTTRTTRPTPSTGWWPWPKRARRSSRPRSRHPHRAGRRHRGRDGG